MQWGDPTFHPLCIGSYCFFHNELEHNSSFLRWNCCLESAPGYRTCHSPRQCEECGAEGKIEDRNAVWSFQNTWAGARWLLWDDLTLADLTWLLVTSRRFSWLIWGCCCWPMEMMLALLCWTATTREFCLLLPPPALSAPFLAPAMGDLVYSSLVLADLSWDINDPWGDLSGDWEPMMECRLLSSSIRISDILFCTKWMNI